MRLHSTQAFADWPGCSGPYSLTMADEPEPSKQAEFEGGEVLFCGATDWAMIGRQANKPKKGDPPVCDSVGDVQSCCICGPVTWLMPCDNSSIIARPY